MQTANRFLDFAQQILSRYQGFGYAYEPAAMLHLENEAQELSEESPKNQNIITNLYHIQNIKEENYLFKQNLTFLTNVLENRMYQNLYPTVEKQIQKVIKEELPQSEEKIISSVSEQLVRLVQKGGLKQFEVLREKILLAQQETTNINLKEQEVLLRKIENIWNSSVYHHYVKNQETKTEQQNYLSNYNNFVYPQEQKVDKLPVQQTHFLEKNETILKENLIQRQNVEKEMVKELRSESKTFVLEHMLQVLRNQEAVLNANQGKSLGNLGEKNRNFVEAIKEFSGVEALEVKQELFTELSQRNDVELQKEIEKEIQTQTKEIVSVKNTEEKQSVQEFKDRMHVLQEQVVKQQNVEIQKVLKPEGLSLEYMQEQSAVEVPNMQEAYKAEGAAEGKEPVQQQEIAQKNNVQLQQNNVQLQQSNVQLQQSNVQLQQSNVQLQQNNVQLQQSNVQLQQNNVQLQKEIETEIVSAKKAEEKQSVQEFKDRMHVLQEQVVKQQNAEPQKVSKTQSISLEYMQEQSAVEVPNMQEAYKAEGTADGKEPVQQQEIAQRNSVQLQQSNVQLQQNNVQLQQSNVQLQQSNVQLQQNNVELQQSNVQLQQNNVQLQKEIETEIVSAKKAEEKQSVQEFKDRMHVLQEQVVKQQNAESQKVSQPESLSLEYMQEQSAVEMSNMPEAYKSERVEAGKETVLQQEIMRQNSVQLQQSNVQLQRNNVQLQQNNVQLQQSNVELKQNSVQLQQSNVQLQQSNVQLQQNNVQLQKEIETEIVSAKKAEEKQSVQEFKDRMHVLQEQVVKQQNAEIQKVLKPESLSLEYMQEQSAVEVPNMQEAYKREGIEGGKEAVLQQEAVLQKNVQLQQNNVQLQQNNVQLQQSNVQLQKKLEKEFETQLKTEKTVSLEKEIGQSTIQKYIHQENHFPENILQKNILVQNVYSEKMMNSRPKNMEQLVLEYPTEEETQMHQQMVQMVQGEIQKIPKVPKVVEMDGNSKDGIAISDQNEQRSQLIEKTKSISEQILVRMETQGLIPATQIRTAAKTVAFHQLSRVLLEHLTSETTVDELQNSMVRILYNYQTETVKQESQQKVLLPQSIKVLKSQLKAPEFIQQMEPAPIYYRSEDQVSPEQQEKTKNLEKQVQEVVKNLKKIEEKTIVHKERIIEQQKAVVHEVLQNQSTAFLMGKDGAGYIRGEVQQSVEEQMNQSVGKIADKVYRQLESKLKSERGRRGLI